MKVGPGGHPRHSTFERRYGAFMVAETRPDHPQCIEREPVAGRQRVGALGSQAGFAVALEQREAACVLHVIVRAGCIVRERALDRRARLAIAPRGRGDHAEQKVCVGMLRSERQHL